MSDVILETATQTIPNNLIEREHPEGYKVVFRGKFSVASDSHYDLGHSARLVISARQKVLNAKDRDRVRAEVAVIGGGLCIVPRLIGPYHKTTVFEIEPLLDRYAPAFSTFVPGDWIVTLPALNKLFDVIIYDVGDDVPRDALAAFLNVGGEIVA